MHGPWLFKTLSIVQIGQETTEIGVQNEQHKSIQVPVTHRGAAYQLVICTGYGRDGSASLARVPGGTVEKSQNRKIHSSVSLQPAPSPLGDSFTCVLAHSKNTQAPELPRYLKHQTVVLLMAVGRLRGMVESMTAVDREGGGPFPLDCPALVVERASTPRQRLVLGDLTDIADLVDEHKISVRFLLEKKRRTQARRASSAREDALGKIPFFPYVQAPAVVVLGHAVRALRANEPHGP